MDIAKALKGEIARIARKEMRSQNESLKKASAQHRRDLASLKKRLTEMESALRRFSKGAPSQNSRPESADAKRERAGRFSAKGFAAHRARLSLSAAEMASLIGVSAQSVYHWEQGKSRPRAAQMSAIGSVRKMRKKEAAYRLSVLEN